MFYQLIRKNCHSGNKLMRRLSSELLEKLYGCEINCRDIHKSVIFAHHARGCTIVAAKISENVVIFQNVSIGANLKFNIAADKWENLRNPIISKRIIVCDEAKILKPIVINENSVVKTGAVITKSIPANSIAYGFNKFRAKDPRYDLVFRRDMPSPAAMVKANKALIEKYEKSNS